MEGHGDKLRHLTAKAFHGIDIGTYRLIKTNRTSLIPPQNKSIAPQHITNTAATYYTATRVTGRRHDDGDEYRWPAAHTLTVFVPSAVARATGNKIISAKSIMPL